MKHNNEIKHIIFNKSFNQNGAYKTEFSRKLLETDYRKTSL